MAVKTRSFGMVRLFDEPLFRLIAINGAAGIVVAILVLAGIFWSNIGNLRNLVLNADDPVLPVLMLAFGLVITLGSVVIGSAIMLLGKEDRGGGSAFRLPEVDKGSALQPVRVTTRSQK